VTPDILVRGAGVVCALGCGRDAIRAADRRSGFAGESGARAAFPARFDAATALPGDRGRRLGRQSAIALTAIIEAVGGDENLADAALVLGTAHGAMHETVEFIDGVLRHGARYASPALFAGSLHNTMAGAVGRALGVRGPSLVLSQGDASFEAALSVALVMLRLGRVSRAVVCAADTFHPVLGVDRRRRHPGEGAGALLLEAHPQGTPGVRVEDAVVGADALRHREGIDAVRLLSGGDAASAERHRAAWEDVFDASRVPVTYPAESLGAFGSLGAVATALEVDRLLRLPAPLPERVLLLQVSRDAPAAAVVLAGAGAGAAP
jgi:hypothetical protein